MLFTVFKINLKGLNKHNEDCKNHIIKSDLIDTTVYAKSLWTSGLKQNCHVSMKQF